MSEWYTVVNHNGILKIYDARNDTYFRPTLRQICDMLTELDQVKEDLARARAELAECKKGETHE